MRTLCRLLQDRMRDNLEAVYVYGSTALGAYIEVSSDIDFVALIKRPPLPTEIQAIAEVHEQMEREIPGTDIMGAYICRNDLGKAYRDIPVYATYFSQKLHTDGTGSDINPVTLWMLRKNSICVWGGKKPLNYEPALEELLAYVRDNMDTYWAGWIGRLENALETDVPDDSAKDHLDESIAWCALGMLRQLYTLREHEITSKIGAGEYGLQVMPAQWHRLIREAIALKRGETVLSNLSPKARLQELINLLRHIHDESITRK